MKLTEMKNIGAELEKKLVAVGIDNAEKLVAMGSQDAFFRMKATYPQVCLVHLYALQGAIDGIDFNMLPQETKAALKAFSDGLK